MTIINTTGRITVDLEMKKAQSGITYVSFGLAVKKRFNTHSR